MINNNPSFDLNTRTLDFENEKVTINYEAKTGGSVSRPYETLLPVTETAQGSLATASAGYHFEKWIDEKENTVSTQLNFVPQKVDGVNVLRHIMQFLQKMKILLLNIRQLKAEASHGQVKV